MSRAAVPRANRDGDGAVAAVAAVPRELRPERRTRRERPFTADRIRTPEEAPNTR